MASTLQIPIENSGFIEYALCSAVALGENMIGRYSAQKANVGILVALVLNIRPESDQDHQVIAGIACYIPSVSRTKYIFMTMGYTITIKPSTIKLLQVLPATFPLSL